MTRRGVHQRAAQKNLGRIRPRRDPPGIAESNSVACNRTDCNNPRCQSELREVTSGQCV